ncbi:hypothetical protein [Desulfovibrio inopinatus]|uniref:hypothetical protein n=1 Tax=Desulfovibrio inopinatus TaxID=102109 RepID=UPI0004196B44|nr:hypothetical protein [Desulfovibrio inopinatus]
MPLSSVRHTRRLSLHGVFDHVVRSANPAHEPGKNLKLLYNTVIRHPALRFGVLCWCRLKNVSSDEVAGLRAMMKAFLAATPAEHDQEEFVRRTAAPLAALLDQVRPPLLRRRKPVSPNARPVLEAVLDDIIAAVSKDIERTWNSHPDDPHIPVAAQIVLPGDEFIDGAVFLDILTGLGSFEYRNITLLFGLIRVAVASNPWMRNQLQPAFEGMSEPLRQRIGWIWHRTAFYDDIFFEHLYNRLTKSQPDREEAARLVAMMENMIGFIVKTSAELLHTPASHRPHPALTCLPKDDDGKPLCNLSPADWKKKRDLGFGDYVPDMDTTYLGLTMARKWIDYVNTAGISADPELLQACEDILSYPWVEIFSEYQVGGSYGKNPPTISMTRPLEYDGAVCLWFDKPFPQPDGRVVREALGNEVCPGHNMDILDAFLVNRDRWHSLEGENLATVQRLLDFHHRAFVSGNFRIEQAVRFYLPLIYVVYAGRLYETVLQLTDAERSLFDPTGKVEDIRRHALEYLCQDIGKHTQNAFDAALAITALVLLRHDRNQPEPVIHSLHVLCDALGEGPGRHPYKAYEWTMVRHPTRILVGSETTTSFFVLNALVEAKHFLGRSKLSNGTKETF